MSRKQGQAFAVKGIKGMYIIGFKIQDPTRSSNFDMGKNSLPKYL